MHPRPILVSLALSLAACGGDDGAPALTPGTDTTVVALAGEHVYFGDPDRRTVDVAVTFPPAELRYTRVTLRLGLRCPATARATPTTAPSSARAITRSTSTPRS